MAHPATIPTVADLDAAEGRLRTLEARRATAGASCSSADSGESSESCTSSGQRVISSNRTTRPSAMPRSSGAGTSDLTDGPSATSNA